MPGSLQIRSNPVSASPRPRAPHSNGTHRLYIGVAIVVFAAISAWLALVIITRLDSLFGRAQITLPSVVGDVLPGVDAQGQSGNQDRINILVLGIDRREHEGDAPSRTDTIFILTVDPKTKSSAILGVPRDLVVDIPYQDGSGTYEDRVNSVYAAGELGEYDGGGIGLMKDVLAAEPFNIEIHKYVIVDFQGFERVIDALGGIEVDVPEAVYDPYYSETELPGDYFPQDFEPGVQHMDGRTALAYARIRFSSDDFDRIQRQQRVIFATIEKAKSLSVLTNAESLWRKYKDAIETDVSDLEIVGYAQLASNVQDNLVAISIGSATTPYTTPQGAAVLIGDDDSITDIVSSVFLDTPAAEGAVSANPIREEEPTPEPVRVQVQNGTDTDGLAARVVAYIAAQGYPVDDLNVANAFDGAPHDVSEIIDIDGKHRQNAYLLAKWLDIPVDQVRDATAAEAEALVDSDAAIIVILGEDVDFDTLIQSPTTSVPGG
jgi:LCP family protein required for cell wall assembly